MSPIESSDDERLDEIYDLVERTILNGLDTTEIVGYLTGLNWDEQGFMFSRSGQLVMDLMRWIWLFEGEEMSIAQFAGRLASVMPTVSIERR